MSEQQIKRKLSAILSADVVGYSRLMGEDEEGTMRRLAELRGITDSVIELHDGRVFNTAGDAVLAEFASPVEAVRTAIEIQNAVQTRNKDLPADKQMLFRIGVNLGDVMIKDGDLLGDGVNVAARLQSIAPPGGICISGSVHDQIEGKLDLSFSAMGEQNLKNISRAVRAFEFMPGQPAGAARPRPKPAPAAKASRGWIVPAIVVLVLAAGGAGAWFGGIIPGGGQEQERERLAWEAVKDTSSSVPVQNFLAEFPNGVHAGAARSKLASLNEAERAAVDKSRREAEAARQQAELDRQRAQAELERQRAEAEAARLRAEAERARLESEAARQRAEAEAARAKAEAEAAKQRADAAKRAAEQPRPAQQAVVAPGASAGIDGLWTGTIECPSGGPRLPAYKRPRQYTVSNGEFPMGEGREDTPPFYRASVRIAKDGTVNGTGTGTGVNAEKFAVAIRGKAVGGELTAQIFLPTRTCALILSR